MTRARRRRTGSAPAVAIALALGVGVASAAPRPDEGPLRNQAFVPVDEAAGEALLRGDRALDADPTAAVDAWFEALAGSATGAAVPYRPERSPEALEAAAASEPRAFEGVEEAVLRRLADPGARAAWVERFGPLGAERLGAGTGPEALLARVERRFPATSAGLRAALVLGDRALARGALGAARTWYGRARVHAALGAGDPDPIVRRLALLDTLDPDPRPAPLGSPRFLGRIELDDPRGPRAALPTDRPGAGLAAGLARVDADEVAVQTATRIHLVDVERGRVSNLFEPAELLPESLPRPTEPYPTRAAPAWVLTPAVEGRRLLAVVGRADPRSAAGNALVCLRLPRAAGPDLERDPALTLPGGELDLGSGRGGLGGGVAPTLLWALDAERRVAPDGRRSADVELPDRTEFQPGPHLGPETAVVAVRSGEEELATRLIGLDANDGRRRWELLLGVGGELDPSDVRLGPANGPASAATPLLAVDGAVFVGTQTGLGSLVDAVDGRLRWTVKNRRRDEDGRGWTAWRAAATPDGSRLAWTPADGDHLYWLPLGPLDAGEHGPFLAPPAPIDADRALAGITVDGQGALVVFAADAGPRAALSARRPATGRRFEAVHLFPGEPLREGLSVGPDGVLACSDRALYLFDPTRELLLVQRMALPSLGLAGSTRWARGGSVHRVGAHALVLESGRLLRLALDG